MKNLFRSAKGNELAWETRPYFRSGDLLLGATSVAAVHWAGDAGADTGFFKGGGGGVVGNCEVLKRGLFAHIRVTFFFPLYEVLGSPKRGGGPDPQDLPPPLDPPLGCYFSID